MTMKWILAVALFAGSAAAQEEGKAIFERACMKCHALTTSTGQRNSRTRWSAVVDEMIARGALVKDEEFERVIDYLSSNYGPKVAINKANAEAISAGLEVPKAVGAAIVEYREKNGSFRTLDDLKKVPTIDAAEIEKKKNNIDFGEPK